MPPSISSFKMKGLTKKSSICRVQIKVTSDLLFLRVISPPLDVINVYDMHVQNSR